MFILPYTYSLGNPVDFDSLAIVARRNNDWRKVARMIQKYNVFASGKNKAWVGPNYRGRNAYLVQAVYATNIKNETKEKIFEVFGLTSPATRANLLGHY